MIIIETFAAIWLYWKIRSIWFKTTEQKAFEEKQNAFHAEQLHDWYKEVTK
jgi:hypothetical protein